MKWNLRGHALPGIVATSSFEVDNERVTRQFGWELRHALNVRNLLDPLTPTRHDLYGFRNAMRSAIIEAYIYGVADEVFYGTIAQAQAKESEIGDHAVFLGAFYGFRGLTEVTLNQISSTPFGRRIVEPTIRTSSMRNYLRGMVYHLWDIALASFAFLEEERTRLAGMRAENSNNPPENTDRELLSDSTSKIPEFKQFKTYEFGPARGTDIPLHASIEALNLLYMRDRPLSDYERILGSLGAAFEEYKCEDVNSPDHDFHNLLRGQIMAAALMEASQAESGNGSPVIIKNFWPLGYYNRDQPVTKGEYPPTPRGAHNAYIKAKGIYAGGM